VVGYQQGEFGYNKISGRLARRIGSRASINVIASSANSDGFRENSDHEDQHLDGKIIRIIGEGSRIIYSTQLYDAQTGIPGMDIFPTLDARQDDRIWNQSLCLDLTLPGAQQLSAALYRNFSRQRYQNPDWFTDARHRRWIYGLELQDTFPLSSMHRMTLGGVFQQKRLDSSENGRQDLNQGSLFAQDAFTIHRSMRLRVAARYDYHQRFDNQLSPDATLTWLAGETNSLFISMRKSYRAPTFNDLYWPQIEYDYDLDELADYREGGNKQVRPEKAVAYQLGARTRKGVMTGEICLFRREMKDLIQWDNVDYSYSYGYWMPVNKAKATFQGVELHAAVQWAVGVQASLAYTFLEARDDLLDKRLPYQPRHQFSGHIQDDIVLVRDQLELTGRLGFEYLDERFADSWEGQRLSSVAVFDGKISARVMGAFEVYLVGKNLGDKHYSLRSGYPLPGRSYYGGLTWEFWD
jgi:outer membrane cobalamin receptor